MALESLPAVAKDSFQEQTSVPADTLLRVAQPPEASLQGSVLMLIQFDVSEEIRLDELRNIFGAHGGSQLQTSCAGICTLPESACGRTDRAPRAGEGERLLGQIKYYDYGVLSVV